MKNRIFWGSVIMLAAILLGCSLARAEFSFFMIDNFEGGSADGWYQFGNIQMSVENNPSAESALKDTIAESGGDYSLKVKGNASNWYAGGLGKVIIADASPFTRLQLDVNGSEKPGKIKIELFVDSSQGQLPKTENKFVAEVPILGPGVSRLSVPFSAFKPEAPTPAEAVWNADQKNGSQGLLKIQFIFLTNQPTGEVEANIDNIVLTY